MATKTKATGIILTQSEGGLVILSLPEPERSRRLARAAAGRKSAITAATRSMAQETRRWEPQDFRAGDRVLTRWGWHEVVSLGPSSLSVRSIVGGPWTDALPYEDVRGRRR